MNKLDCQNWNQETLSKMNQLIREIFTSDNPQGIAFVWLQQMDKELSRRLKGLRQKKYRMEKTLQGNVIDVKAKIGRAKKIQ